MEKFEWSPDLTFKFIEALEKEECLWNPKNLLFTHRASNVEAYSRIKQALGFEGTWLDLRKKKELLVSAFRKVHQTKLNREDYVPSWYGYAALEKFLGNVYVPKKTARKNNDASVDEDQNYITQNSNDSFEETKSEISFVNTDDIYDTSSTKKRKKPMSDEEVFEDPIEMRHKNTKSPQKDFYTLYCDLLAAKLRRFEDETCEILMNEIDNIVFRFKMKESQIK